MPQQNLTRYEALRFRIDNDAVRQEAEEFHGGEVKKTAVVRAIQQARKNPSGFASNSLTDPFNATASILLALCKLYSPLDHEDLIRQARAIKGRRLRLQGVDYEEMRSAVNA